MKTPYEELKENHLRGWNTWYVRSVLAHVLMPEGFLLNFSIKNVFTADHLREALIARHDQTDERVTPGIRSYDGAYTELKVEWQDLCFEIRTAEVDGELVAHVARRDQTDKNAYVMVESGILWNRPGRLWREGDTLRASLEGREVAVYATEAVATVPHTKAVTPYLAVRMDCAGAEFGISTGSRRDLADIRRLVDAARAVCAASGERYGEDVDLYDAIQSCAAWNTIYDAEGDRVITPVSRVWSSWWWGGYVLFEWDTYFLAMLAGLGCKAVAYANAIEMTREVRVCGFVPNAAAGDRLRSADHSEPPVGAMAVFELYQRYGDKWFVEEVLDDLLTWNRWWHAKRSRDGYLCLGSSPCAVVGRHIEHDGKPSLERAILESGLDTSPMYEDMPFDAESGLMLVADVGLMGLYVGDCRYLAELAEALGRSTEAHELRERGGFYADRLQTLWDEETGLFLNTRLDTGERLRRLSPTHFYPLVGAVPTQAQAERMVREHFYSAEEFWGEWMMPSIARCDPAYPQQYHWRGRIWAPMNFLVYTGLRNYDLARARRDLAEKSAALLRKEWCAHGHIYENYNADTGTGPDSLTSDAFYHWGGLLGLIGLMDAHPERAPLPFVAK